VGSTVIDSGIFKDMFGTAAMRTVFGDDNLIACYVRAEVALALAQGRTGVIPHEDAAAIARLAPKVAIDRAALKEEAENVGYPILGLVRQLSAGTGKAGHWVHWGATTQDIMDTGVVLQMREGIALIEAELAAVSAALEKLAARYRDTPMAGRTHLQQALPVTFGYKCAVWLSMLQRHAERLEQMKPRVLVAQLGGAAGTLASLGGKGLDVLAAYAHELDLAEPPISWHVARDGMVEAVQVLALLTGSLGKIGFDVMLMMATEIAEAFEPFAAHRGASSTMPQKRNPISSEVLVANSKAVRQQAGLMLDAMVQDFERATGPWHIEWMALPEAFVLTAGALAQARVMLEGLIVDEARMAANLAMTRGLIVAEAVMMGLAPYTGRTQAHDIVYDACRAAITGNRPLAEVLEANGIVRSHMSTQEIARLCDPAGYLGVAPQMVDRVLKRPARAIVGKSKRTAAPVEAAATRKAPKK
jgi:3-carboxy-cis,cis-muconate cycloisomerase